MRTCTRLIAFDAGHRVLGHEGKCANLHGHRYTAEITCQAAGLDPLGRVVDFGRVKEIVGTWVDQNWDHVMILNRRDPLYLGVHDLSMFGPRPPFLMEGNPTAENLAEFLLRHSQKLLKPFNIGVSRVRIYETPNCYADATDENVPVRVEDRDPAAPEDSDVSDASDDGAGDAYLTSHRRAHDEPPRPKVIT